MKISPHRLSFVLAVASVAGVRAANPDPCPWRPDSKSHHATAKVGTAGGGGDLEIYIDYTVSWEARKCGENPVEYQKLKWALSPKPKNIAIPNGSTLSTPNPTPGGAPIPMSIPNGSTWSIIDVGSTIVLADKMQIVVHIDFTNHASPPAGAACGPNPQTATIDGPGGNLTFQDSGHGLFFQVTSPAGGVYTYPGFVAAKPCSVSNPAPKNP